MESKRTKEMMTRDNKKNMMNYLRGHKDKEKKRTGKICFPSFRSSRYHGSNL